MLLFIARRVNGIEQQVNLLLTEHFCFNAFLDKLRI